jgi:VanZ family protein
MSKVYLVLAILWTVGMIVALSMPTSGLPSVRVPHADKAVHFTMFAGFGWLWLRAARNGGKVIIVFITGLVFAILSEISQGILPTNRTPSAADVAANVSGLLIATVFFVWTRRGRSADQKQ